LNVPDPFAPSKTPIALGVDENSPRHVYALDSERMLMFFNSAELSPYGDKRNPLYMSIVSKRDFSRIGDPLVVFDAAKEYPGVFETPFVEMAKLSDVVDGRRFLFFRLIDRAHTVGYKSERPPSNEATKVCGVHYSILEI
jgi:hypothetical protein